MRIRAAPWILALWLPAMLVVGQTHAQEPSNGEDRCQAAPNGEEERTDTTETLEDCRGVLKPPPTGDREITEEPPDVGRTPTIRPDDLPETQHPE